MSRLVYVVAFAMGAFQLYSSIVRVLDPVILQNLHLMFSLVLIFLTGINKAAKAGKKPFWMLLPAAMLVLALIGTLYVHINYFEMVYRVGRSSQLDLLIGAILIVVVLEATRTTFGPAIPILTVIGIAYMFAGPYMPGILYHGGFSAKRVLATLATSFNGLYGTLLGSSATFIALFMLLGGFLTKTGAGKFFVDVALAIGGRFRAGPGLATVAASGLMGSINGSAVAVVAATGTFTLPLMTERGYKPEFAAAVCSVASTGGMILPPVMGVGAFIMAELTGTPYGLVALYATIPALLYYLLCAAVVVVRAKKVGLLTIPKEQVPNLSKTLREGAAFLLPIISIVACLSMGYSTTKAALYSIGLLVLIYLATLLRRTPKALLRFDGYKPLLDGLVDGAMACIGVAATMASVGILTNCIVATGLANRLVSLILGIGQENPLICLFITMVLTLIFGMGVPTTAAYIILAMMAAPALINIGLPVLPVHMFIFYFAAIANLTPPVAPSTIVAAKMANANYVLACVDALKMSLAAFVLPYIFVMRPAMMLMGDFWSVVDVVGTSIVGLISLAFFTERYVVERTSLLQQAALLAAALLLIFPLPLLFSAVGILLFGGVLVVQAKAKAAQSACL